MTANTYSEESEKMEFPGITVGIFLVFLLLFLCSCGDPEVVRIYVGPESSGGNEGAEEASFTNIKSAIDLAKRLRAEGETRPIEVRLQPGDYHLDSPLEIDSSLGDFSLAGSGPEAVAVKGSAVLDLGWEQHEGSVYASKIPSGLYIDQLYADGVLQILARYPDYDENGGHFQGHAPDAFSKERISSWKNPVGAVLNSMHSHEWGDFHHVITGLSPEGEPVLEGGHQNNRPAEPHPEYRMVENVFEELDSPGEWYLDKEKGLLYYWPAVNIDLKTARFEGVVLKNLLRIVGTEDSPARNIRVSGIRFENAQRTFMEDYEPLLRSDWTIYRGGAVSIHGAEKCAIRDCEFRNLGGNVVFISGYNREIEISGNHIHDCGASGICFVGDPGAVRSPSFQYNQFVDLSEMDTRPGPKSNSYPARCIADNNLICRTGRHEKQTAGVQIAMAMKITVSNNSIYEVPRAGINIGDGTWGGHVIEHNDVFDTVLESGDHGSFNSWGRDRFWHPDRKVLNKQLLENPNMFEWDAIHTTVIRNNRFRCDHGWDIDLDDGSSNYHIYNNLCLNGGIKLREGFARTVENNIMVNNGFHPHVWFLNSRDIFRKNIVSAKHKDIRLQDWGEEIDYNLFPDEGSLETARENGTDTNSTFGEPEFSDPDNLDFSVVENSPALSLGFVNFPMDQFGVKKPHLKRIAATPVVPELISSLGGELPVRRAVAWLGAEISNITTMEERSASGLGKSSGVIISEIPAGSAAARSGLMEGDVIIMAEGEDVNSIPDLLKIHQENNWTGKLDLVIYRNQVEQSLTVKTK